MSGLSIIPILWSQYRTVPEGTMSMCRLSFSLVRSKGLQRKYILCLKRNCLSENKNENEICRPVQKLWINQLFGWQLTCHPIHMFTCPIPSCRYGQPPPALRTFCSTTPVGRPPQAAPWSRGWVRTPPPPGLVTTSKSKDNYLGWGIS